MNDITEYNKYKLFGFDFNKSHYKLSYILVCWYYAVLGICVEFLWNLFSLTAVYYILHLDYKINTSINLL